MLWAQKNKESKIFLPIDSITNLITYQEVVKVEGITKDELYIRAREWFAKTFVSAQDVIQMDDKASGKIIGKGSSSGFYSILMSIIPYSLTYTVSITAKDGRYRYEISPFLVDGYPTEPHYVLYNKGKGPLAKKIPPHINRIAESLTSGIKEALNKQSNGFKSKDDF